jgi:DNA-binding IclR family transcriptional regulator
MTTTKELAGSLAAWWADMLAHKTDELVWVGVLSGSDVEIVNHAVRPHDLSQIVNATGAIPWHACALGHAVVAFLDQDAQTALLSIPLQPLTGLTVTDPVALRRQLNVARERGYAVEAHAAALGDAGIAAPIYDVSGRVVGAIGIVGPADRLLPADRQEALAEEVLAVASALSENASGR